MWVNAKSKDELYAALEAVKKKKGGEYISGKDQWDGHGSGWYWCDVRGIYFGRGATDYVAQAFWYEDRIREIKDEIKELTDVLVEARRTTR